MKGLTSRFGQLIVFLCCAAPSVASADVVNDLQARGVRISTSSATLVSEVELAAHLKESTALRKALTLATKQLEDQRKLIEELNQQITRLNQQAVAANAQLANVKDTLTNNRLVGTIKALEGQVRLVDESRDQKQKQELTLQGQVSTARDAIIANVLETRKIADEVSAKYRKVDQETQDLIARFNKEHGTSVMLQPSTVFTANVRKLEQLESGMRSEAISLRRDGNTYWARAKLNGEYVAEMIVDSGATKVVLPFDDAIKAGMKPVADTPQVRISVADGRTSTGKLMTIDSLQVGQFTAKNVECIVLNANVKNASPLLGMSFLSQFKFELNAGKSTLSLVRLGEEGDDVSKDSTPLNRAPFELVNAAWQLVPAGPEVKYWSNRDFKLRTLPPELRDTLVVVRENEKFDWLAGEVVAKRPAIVYVALLRQTVTTNKQGKKQVNRNFFANTIGNLKDQGWTLIEGFDPEGRDDEEWVWSLFSKRFEPGVINIPPPITPRVRIVFFLGVAEDK